MDAVTLYQGDCLDVMPKLLADGVQVDAVVTDAPYHLESISDRLGKPGSAPIQHGADGAYARVSKGFMGKAWDGGDVAFRARTWQQALMLLKPGGYLVAFGGPRTSHRVASAIEDAGGVIRDTILDLVDADEDLLNFLGSLAPEQLGLFFKLCEHQPALAAWLHGQGFPKSHDQEGAWDGWGTALKPAFEPIIVAQRPFDRSVEANLARYGVGAMNIDACRIHAAGEEPFERDGEAAADRRYRESSNEGFTATPGRRYRRKRLNPGATVNRTGAFKQPDQIYDGELKPGRWPANVVHDGSGQVLEFFARFGGAKGAHDPVTVRGADKFRGVYNGFGGNQEHGASFQGDSGSAARFFYCAKATNAERVYRCTTCRVHQLGKPACGCTDAKGAATLTSHPTVKPIALMRWLCRLVTPKGGLILDPFAGSGTTGQAAVEEGFRAILIEREAEYADDIAVRLQGKLVRHRSAPIDARAPLLSAMGAA